MYHRFNRRPTDHWGGTLPIHYRCAAFGLHLFKHLCQSVSIRLFRDPPGTWEVSTDRWWNGEHHLTYKIAYSFAGKQPIRQSTGVDSHVFFMVRIENHEHE